MATIWSEDMSEPLDLVKQRSTDDPMERTFIDPMLKNLVGSTITNGEILKDLDNKLGMFFIFNDLSIRKSGNYRIKFSLMCIEMMISVKLTLQTKVLASVFSKVVSVYPAKNFPGVVESSPLSVCFAKQGVKIHVRKENMIPK
ncbi:hypothetical protein BB559_002444 [Furculomyces boomerangus]|nr:hypothetical protein BB559_002444 [Furculomyces boomerangus]PVZ99328.1 hypothetical protein BB558_004670 [Smittium angustum]